LVDGETACAKVIANGVPTAARLNHLILLLFFSDGGSAAGRSVPTGQFLPEAFTRG
jgi:hypothetical protein